MKVKGKNAFIYNQAYLFHAKGDFKNALASLQQVEFNDLYYQLDMRVILLKSYYEMGDDDSFFYHTAAFKIFLTRNKLVSEYQRKIYRNLIKYTTQMMNAFDDHKKLLKVKEEVDRIKQIADIGWLNIQLRKLIQMQ